MTGSGYTVGFGLAVATYSVLNLVWLAFLSWLVSRVVRDERPPLRAGLCVGIGLVIAWALHFALEALGLGIITVTRHFSATARVVHLIVPLAVFGLQWWLFQRSSNETEDVVEIFE